MHALAFADSGSAWHESLAAHHLDLASLGAAYLFSLLNGVFAAAAFVAARSLLVISPNRGCRDYGLYASAVLTALAVATVLDNSLSPAPPVLPYAALPHLGVLLLIHLWIYYRQEPWLVALGAASVAGAVPALAIADLAGLEPRTAHWLAVLVLVALLAVLWRSSVATKRGYANARSIYVGSKEHAAGTARPQAPWLGLPQWLALIAASLALAALNAVLRGTPLVEIPAATVAIETLTLLAVTSCVSAIPAGAYWLARHGWMPGLTRFVWLVWLVVGFAFTYGNFLLGLDRL